MLSSFVSTSFPAVQVIIKSFQTISGLENCTYLFFYTVGKDLGENYEPISMASAIVKVLERIINSAVVRNLEANNVLHSSQHGFCSGRSVDISLLELYDHIIKLLGIEVPADMTLLLLTNCVTSDLQLNYVQSSLKRNPCSGSLIFFICNLNVFSYLMTLVTVFFLPLCMF